MLWDETNFLPEVICIVCWMRGSTWPVDKLVIVIDMEPLRLLFQQDRRRDEHFHLKVTRTKDS